jgi:hypothetical protein
MSLSLKVTSMLNSRSRQYGKRSVTRVLAAIALAASLASVGLLHAFPPEPDPVTDGGAEGTTAFIGVNVIPMDRERVLPYQIVIVEGDRIVRIGPANEVEVPKGAVTIDGRGKYMIPGLGEMHAHVPPQGGREWMEQVLFLYLSNGITTVSGRTCTAVACSAPGSTRPVPRSTATASRARTPRGAPSPTRNRPVTIS